MDTDLVTIADVPLALSDGELPTTIIPVAKLGSYQDRRYGKFGITDDDLSSWQRNLTDAFGGRAAIDFDHAPEKGQGTKAAGWITSLERKTGAELQAVDAKRFAKLDPDAVYAASRVEWSKAGADAIRNREYAYVSPTFAANWTDESGAKRGRTLLGAGLTNRPFLRRGMPAISLSADDLTEPAVELAASASDSRPRMSTAIAKKLGLAEDADEATILAAIPEGFAPGVIVLSAEDHASLVARAATGDQAVTTLADERYTTAWDKALSEGRVAPASKDDFDRIKTESGVDLAVKTLDGLQGKVVPTEARGSGKDRKAEADDGIDAERLELHETVEARAAKDGIAYEAALTKVLEEGDRS